MPATQSRKFKNKSNKMRILAITILKLRPGLNAAAFSTYTVKISDLKVVSFMSYTYNIQGRSDRTMRHSAEMMQGRKLKFQLIICKDFRGCKSLRIR